jgi:GAF domain-containing protein
LPITAAPDMPVRDLLARAAQRAAEVFRVPLASVVWKGGPGGWWLENAGLATWTQPDAWSPEQDHSPLAAVLMRNETLVIADTARVPEFAGRRLVSDVEPEPNVASDEAAQEEMVRQPDRFEGLVAFAGLPVRYKQGVLRGALALHDANVRTFTGDELALLAAMANELGAEMDSLAAEPTPLRPTTTEAAVAEADARRGATSAVVLVVPALAR